MGGAVWKVLTPQVPQAGREGAPLWSDQGVAGRDPCHIPNPTVYSTGTLRSTSLLVLKGRN